MLGIWPLNITYYGVDTKCEYEEMGQKIISI